MAVDRLASDPPDDEAASASPRNKDALTETALGGGQPAAGRAVRVNVAGVALVSVLAIAAMAPTLGGSFLPGDDEHFVLNHTLVNRPGLLNAIRLFGIVHRDLYQPIPMVSFAFDTAVFGHRAWGFHLTNVLWHAVAAVLVWVLVRLRWERWWLATLAGAVFAVHPQAVEPVGTVTARIVQMGVTFSLAAIVAFLVWSRRPVGEGGWLAASVLLTLLAMTSKVQVALPILLLIVVYGQQRRSIRAWWLAWCGLAGIALFFTAFAWWTTAQTGLMAAARGDLPGSLPGRAVLAMGLYLRHFVWPMGLSTWYLPPAEWSWMHPAVGIGIVSLIGVTAAAGVCYVRGARIAASGLTWYLVVLLPMLCASGFRNLIAADRYTYLANVGMALVVTSLVVFGVQRWRERSGGSRGAVVGGILVGGALVALMATSWVHARHYRTGLAYYQRVAALYPDARWVHLDVGWELARAGRLDDAEREARAESDLPRGDRDRAALLLGWIAEKRGKLDLAEAYLTAFAEALPQEPDAQYQLGRLLHKRGYLDRAVAAYQRALLIHPEHLPSLESLARAYQRMGRIEEASGVLRRVLQISPQHVAALSRLAAIELERGRQAEAEQLCRRALDIDPSHAQAMTNLAVILTQTNRANEALSLYNEALVQSPRLVSARLNRAMLLRGWGHNLQAAEDYRVILSTDPGCVPALEGMQELLFKMSPKDGAQRAVRMWASAIKNAGAKPGLLAGLAWAQTLAGADDQAEQTARKCLAQNANQVPAHLALAMVALHRDQAQAAMNAVEQALAHGGARRPDDLERAAQAIGAFGLKHRTEPLPYFLVGQLMVALNRRPMAQQAFDDLSKLTDDPVWQDRVQRAMGFWQTSTSRTGTQSQPASVPPTSAARREAPSTGK